jgi:hypothetical protein
MTKTCTACDTDANLRVYYFAPYNVEGERGRVVLCRSCWQSIEVGGVPVPATDTPIRGGGGR